MAHVAEPLYRLIRKEVKWEWNSSTEDASQALNDKLVKYPVLFSVSGLAKRVLSPDRRLIYSSWDHSLSKGQTGKTETFRVFIFRPYESSTQLQRRGTGVLGAHRRVSEMEGLHSCSEQSSFVSDHNPLCWLRRQKDPRGKFSR